MVIRYNKHRLKENEHALVSPRCVSGASVSGFGQTNSESSCLFVGVAIWLSFQQTLFEGVNTPNAPNSYIQCIKMPKWVMFPLPPHSFCCCTSPIHMGLSCSLLVEFILPWLPWINDTYLWYRYEWNMLPLLSYLTQVFDSTDNICDVVNSFPHSEDRTCYQPCHGLIIMSF